MYDNSNSRRLATPLALGVVLICAGIGAGAATARPTGDATSSIVGGRPTPIYKLPWLAYVQAFNRRGRGFSCTGTVVSPRVVLTAGHCVESVETGRTFPASEYEVVTGVTDLSEATPGNVSKVSQALVFPQFSLSTLRGDAGVLILSAPTSAPSIPMARLSETGEPAAGTSVEIAGWGLTRGDARKPPTALQSADFVLQSSDYCKLHTQAFYPYFSAAWQICAVDSPGFVVSGCNGDSGGPAIARLPDGSAVEIGITSLGARRCSPKRPSIYTRVDQVVAWVDEWIAAGEGLAPPPPIPRQSRRLPFLGRAVAKRLAFVALREDFRRRFKAGRQKRIRCSRVEREKVKCSVSWWQGPNDYYGTITVYLTVSENEFVWVDRYRIHWVNDHCWFDSGHRGRCSIHTQSR